jgi:glycosyltransferase involved in cell wall biosynthesis
MNNLFSIVIPTFNQGSLLKKCIKSILAQSYKNYEIIVIDNHSSDNTKKIISEFKKKIIYKKIRNKGVIAKSRNLGIKLAKGKWIAFLDSDDQWFSTKLEKANRLIKEKDFEVFCNAEFFEKNNKVKLNIPGPFEKNFYKQMLIKGNRLSTSASIVNRNYIIKNKILFAEPKKFISCEDYFFFLELARKNANFYFHNEPLGKHLMHNKSVSADNVKHAKAEIEVIKHHIFKLQRFSKNKKKLFLLASLNRKIKKEVIYMIKNIYKPFNLINLLLLGLRAPIIFSSTLKFLFVKKFKEFYYNIF